MTVDEDYMWIYGSVDVAQRTASTFPPEDIVLYYVQRRGRDGRVFVVFLCCVCVSLFGRHPGWVLH